MVRHGIGLQEESLVILTKKTFVGSIKVYEVDEDPKTISHDIPKGSLIAFQDENGSIPVLYQKQSDGDNTDVMMIDLVTP